MKSSFLLLLLIECANVRFAAAAAAADPRPTVTTINLKTIPGTRETAHWIRCCLASAGKENHSFLQKNKIVRLDSAGILRHERHEKNACARKKSKSVLFYFQRKDLEFLSAVWLALTELKRLLMDGDI